MGIDYPVTGYAKRHKKTPPAILSRKKEHYTTIHELRFIDRLRDDQLLGYYVGLLQRDVFEDCHGLAIDEFAVYEKIIRRLGHVPTRREIEAFGGCDGKT
jgi:hypothetical protein